MSNCQVINCLVRDFRCERSSSDQMFLWGIVSEELSGEELSSEMLSGKKLSVDKLMR